MKSFEQYIERDIRINNDDKLEIKFGSQKNIVFLQNKKIASFGIRYKGNIDLYKVVDFLLATGDYDNLKNKTFKNSIVLESGFVIEERYRNKGYGKVIINKIFKDNKDIDNILLYALENQDALGFWLKIGGEIVYNYNDEVYFINIKR